MISPPWHEWRTGKAHNTWLISTPPPSPRLFEIHPANAQNTSWVFDVASNNTYNFPLHINSSATQRNTFTYFFFVLRFSAKLPPFQRPKQVEVYNIVTDKKCKTTWNIHASLVIVVRGNRRLRLRRPRRSSCAISRSWWTGWRRLCQQRPTGKKKCI